MKILGLSAGTLNGANDSLCKEALIKKINSREQLEYTDEDVE